MAGEVYQGGAWHDGEAIESVYAGGQWHDNPYIEVYQGGAWHVLRTGVTAPTEVPGNPNFTYSGGTVTATWTNTSTEWNIRVELYTNGQLETGSVYSPGTTSAQLSGAQSGDLAYIQVRYENVAGSGPWAKSAEKPIT